MQQSFDTAGIDISGMIDRSIGFGDKARRIGQETLNLSVRNFESATNAGRDLAGAIRNARADATRIHFDYMKKLMAAFTDHSRKIADIMTATAEQAAETGEQAAQATQKLSQRAMETADRSVERSRTLLSEPDSSSRSRETQMPLPFAPDARHDRMIDLIHVECGA
ncbi:MAG: phasin family protein [Methylobacteriaceae bacterium]|nr:phasin family protein [Methylobacteriaceae bacterium]